MKSQIICPDGKSACPNGNTCCFDGNKYYCCPVVDGTCCADGKNCCPIWAPVCDIVQHQCTTAGAFALGARVSHLFSTPMRQTLSVVNADA